MSFVVHYEKPVCIDAQHQYECLCISTFVRWAYHGRSDRLPCKKSPKIQGIHTACDILVATRRSGKFSLLQIFLLVALVAKIKRAKNFYALYARLIFRYGVKIKRANIYSATKNACKNFPIYGIIMSALI